MQLILLVGFFIVVFALVCWGILKGNSSVRILAAFAAIILACYVGFGFGVAWERLRTMDTYGYWIGQYSFHLHDLVEHQQINELTNDIVLFDTKFGPHQYEPKVLEDTMYQIMKLGPYRTNIDAAALPQSTNAATPSH